MRLLSLFGLLLILALPCWSQSDQCGSNGTPEERRYARYMDRISDSINPQRIFASKTVKIAMYRIRHDDGSGARSDFEFANEINNLNSYFLGNGICFTLVRIENIDNSSYINADWGDDGTADSMKTVIKNAHPFFGDAITIYVLPPERWYRGSSFGIPSTGMIMTSNTSGKWGTSHIAHEMGHVLGNFHTHDDSGGAHLEFVTRVAICNAIPLVNDQGLWFDCCVGADGFCDTNADPNLGDTTSYGVPRVDGATCLFEDTTLTDYWGDSYNPHVENIMSYAPTNCRTIFSGAQWDRMHITLDLNTDFSNKKVGNNLSLNGQTITSGRKHRSAKQWIRVSNSNTYEVLQTAQVTHEAEQYVDMFPGFNASPGSATGFYVARPRGLCDNDSLHIYGYEPDEGDTLVAGSYGEGYVYEDEILFPPFDAENTYFGQSVAADGDYLVVGRPDVDVGPYPRMGAVHVYYRNAGTWLLQATLAPSDSSSYMDFGASVDIQGKYIIVGAPSAGTGGKCYIYKRGGSTWTQRANLTGSGAQTGSRFGIDVAITDGYAIAGAFLQNYNVTEYDAGAAYIFNEDGIAWFQQQMLLAPAPASGHRFGTSVDITTNRAIVGTPKDGGGVGHSFLRSGSSWAHENEFIGSEIGPDDQFGQFVAIDGDDVIITAPYHKVGSTTAGNAYHFQRNGAAWLQKHIFTHTDTDASHRRFGSSLSFRGDEVVIGATTNVIYTNRAYMFERNYAGDWNQTVTLDSNIEYSGDSFGNSIALSDNFCAVGNYRYSEVQDLNGAVFIFLKE